MNPVTVNVGHTVSASLVFLDQNGNPMLATPTPDAPPTWSNANGAADLTLTAAANGLTATDVATAAGSDTLSVNLTVGGKAFGASVPITISPAPQVLTSVEIETTVS